MNKSLAIVTLRPLNINLLKQHIPRMEKPDARTHILIKGARVHNLKNVDLELPKNKLIVVTGVSGSGKSSLVFDTLYAEGQRRYVESLSSYARQFLMRMNKPDVDYIKGLAPAIAIEQRVTSKSSRSTVGTFTEIYEYLRLLYARIGKTYSPISGNIVKKDDVSDVVEYIHSFAEGCRVQLFVPIKPKQGRSLFEQLTILQQNGFSRIVVDEEVKKIEEYLNTPTGALLETISVEEKVAGKSKARKTKKDSTKPVVELPAHKSIFLLIDRFTVQPHDEDNRMRIADSVKTAFDEGDGMCGVEILDKEKRTFSNRFEADGLIFEEPNPHFFSFNSPFGACPECEGFGQVMGIDPDLVFPDKSLSVFEEAIAPWRSEKMKEWYDALVKTGIKFNFPIHRSISDLTEQEYDLLWTGNKYFKGLNDFFKHIEAQTFKIQYRVMLSRYRGKTTCPSCKGSRIRKETAFVKVGERSLGELVQLPIDQLSVFFQNLKLNKTDAHIAKQLMIEINNRLAFMMHVGLSYLTLNRLAGSLSGGETQRIQLTRSLGSNLTSSLYILDEPSIGLHPRDTGRLTGVLQNLRNLGNTVIVVEHEEEMMRAADYIVDMGPLAGKLGGEVVFHGSFEQIQSDNKSLTTKYLTGKVEIELPKNRRKALNHITVHGARQHNLKNVIVDFPLNCLCVVTGVSGSGKTTLVKQILHPALERQIASGNEKPGLFDKLSGDIDRISSIEMIDQDPLGKSSRSNPVTYVKAYDEIRELFANQASAKIKGYLSRAFSFNVEGGRCETCKGDGEVVVEMQFLADVHLTCEECNGKRFKEDVLEVQYKAKNISEVLDMTVDEAIEFFADEKSIIDKIKPLQDVGLGYISLGQRSSTLSGGEAQRVKLASFLTKGKAADPVLFIFDEPTTGLHFHDINKLLIALNALIERGHSVIIIEHNLEIVKNADWVIDLGPDGGIDGGGLVFTGTPEELMKCKPSYTGMFLKEKLKKQLAKV